MDTKAVAEIIKEASTTNPLKINYQTIKTVTFEMSETMLENLKKTLLSVGYTNEIPKNLTLEIVVDSHLSDTDPENIIVFNSERIRAKKRFIKAEVIGLDGHFMIYDVNGRFASVL